MVVKKLNQTLSCCPSQWEGKLDDGRMFYIHYRWGNLTIDVSKNPTDDVLVALDGERIYNNQLGDNLDGMIKESQVIKIMKQIGFIFNQL